jgi:hypothetical protein
MRQAFRLKSLAVVLLAAVAATMIVLALQPKAQPRVQLARSFVPATSVGAPTQPSSLWIGDSYTAGEGASSAQDAESCRAAAVMGWICNLDAEAGTGFVNDGHVNEPVASRLATDRTQYLADVVIVDAGRDDVTFAASRVRRAIAMTFRRIHADWPKARLVVIDPYLMTSSKEIDPALTQYLRSTTKRYGGLFLDPIAEGWISPAKTQGLTTADGLDPKPAGHRYIARHLVADFRRHGLSDLPITDQLNSR